MLIFAISCVFYRSIDKFFISFLHREFNVVFKQDNLMVHFINVGQGDAIAINLPNDEILLIDAGPANYNVAYTTYLKEKVLNTKLNNKIDYLILTHADSDHCAGARKLLEEFEVEQVYMPIVDSDTKTYKDLKSYIESNCKCDIISREVNLSFEDCAIDVMGLYQFNDTNESSAIIKITYLNSSFLFMADVSSETEELLVEEYGSRLDCDVLKVAHHGSSYSTSLDFLEIATPKYSVISVGTNSYGHPTQTVINNLSSVNSEILRTDKNNNILFTVGDNYKLSCNYNRYVVSAFYVDYRIFVLVVDLVLFVNVVIITFKKQKNKHINI